MTGAAVSRPDHGDARKGATSLQICHARPSDLGAGAWRELCRRAGAAGFGTLMTPPLWRLSAGAPVDAPADADMCDPAYAAAGRPVTDALRDMADEAARHGLLLGMDLQLERIAADAVEGTRIPGAYRDEPDPPARDPRRAVADWYTLRLRGDSLPPAFFQAWQERLGNWLRSGLRVVRCMAPQALASADWQRLLEPLRAEFPDACFLADTPGLGPAQLQALQPAGFDAVFSSVPWWDFRAEWLAEEYGRLRAVAPAVLAMPDTPVRPGPQGRYGRAVWTAALCGDGLLAAPRDETQWELAGAAVRWQAANPCFGAPQVIAGDAGFCTVLARAAAAASEAGSTFHVLLVNPADTAVARTDWAATHALMPPDPGKGAVQLRHPLPPAGFRLFSSGPPGSRAWVSAPAPRADVRQSSRIAVERVTPVLECGRLAPKAAVGEHVTVRADIFMDGHDLLAAQLQWRAADASAWESVPMRFLGNDRWEAGFVPARVGPHLFRLQAWLDDWESYREALRKKHAAGQPVELDVQEGLQRLRAALAARREDDEPARHRVEALLRRFEDTSPPAGEAVRELLDDRLAEAVALLADRPHLYTTPDPYPLWVDRRAAAFASWYELFPRSQSPEPGRHGTFRDVEARLADVRAMGFDVLYFPPIHPIGRTHRKGPNNSLHAGPDDPGSPYAIGSPEGGHDAIHPELGTLEDFLRLVREAAAQGLEIALDFAIQCSPDHPWLRERPEWFTRRADGSIRYAENPPKKYEDIVNVSFYAANARRHRNLPLWRALRDIVLFWIEQGVRIFRVDNPHTKPLPFWQWLIADVRARHPDAIFLSEAFTRPAMMYRLAKIGFTQSYTYFTWRNEKHEIAAYLEELSGEPVASFFRPNFFVNTPDINPYYLQTGGRAAFLARAALAALGSGLWGMYSGFELCEGAPVPGKEEYLDSEKYQLRTRDWNAPGHIKDHIARLNAMRRAQPALWSVRGYRSVHNANPHVLSFLKSAPGGGSSVLVAINLDPHHAQHAVLELPGDVPAATLDLVDGGRHDWPGHRLPVHLSLDQPYRVWRLQQPDRPQETNA